MGRHVRQLDLDFGELEDDLRLQEQLSSTRKEDRAPTVRLVEYSAFPRVSSKQRIRRGFTRDESTSGMCLGADHPEDCGALLRVVVRSVDGQPTLDTLARVVWCARREDDRFWMGLQVVPDANRKMQFARGVEGDFGLAETA